MNFDLNIDNYTKEELIQMFELPKEFNQNIVEMQEAKMKDSILNNKDIPTNVQKKTLDFILKAKNVILNSNNQTDNKQNNDNKLLKLLSQKTASMFVMPSEEITKEL
jgi:hypothetical protein